MITNPKPPKTAKEIRKLVNSAIKPIKGGPIKNPIKLILVTMVNAIPGGTFGWLPAVLKTIGITLETPKPTSIKAIVAGSK